MRILSIDGGGIRGTLSARLIERINESFPGWCERSDIIAGTSTGGILALAISAGIEPSVIVDLYKSKGANIFSNRDWIDSITHLDELKRANFSNQGLKNALEDVFEDRTMGSLPIRTIICAFRLDAPSRYPNMPNSWRPRFMDSTDDRDKCLTLVDAALRTSAAPTYFPSWQGYVDGGVAANNPSMSALADALRDGCSIDDISLLSIGTGLNPHIIEDQVGDNGEIVSNDWGYLNWIPHLIPIFMEAPVFATDFYVRQILGERYWRLQPLLSQPIDLADYEKVPDLIDIANQENISDLLTWLGCHWASTA